VEIRLPSQSLFLAGESLEVDNLVKRARPIDGAGPGSRALVSQAVPSVSPASRSLAISESNIDYESVAAAYQSRTGTPADLYRQVRDLSLSGSTARFVDVYA
jgi:hypothetical protein